MEFAVAGYCLGTKNEFILTATSVGTLHPLRPMRSCQGGGGGGKAGGGMPLQPGPSCPPKTRPIPYTTPTYTPQNHVHKTTKVTTKIDRMIVTKHKLQGLATTTTTTTANTNHHHQQHNTRESYQHWMTVQFMTPTAWSSLPVALLAGAHTTDRPDSPNGLTSG